MKAVKALVQGKSVAEFRAIMLDRPASKREAVERAIVELDRRLVGVHKYGHKHGVTPWYIEKRAELQKKRYSLEPCAVTTAGCLIDLDREDTERTARTLAARKTNQARWRLEHRGGISWHGENGRLRKNRKPRS
ncbi:unnamed protein product [marine sediment metagenome]|uniref:Uncharacterized protein n=1 Tax=marine sediment metagenome TaxID=412755 RepID=X1P595_9ZZZZ